MGLVESPLTILFAVYLAAVLSFLSVYDFHHLIIPNTANLASLAGALVFAFTAAERSADASIIGGAVGAGSFATLALLYWRIRRRAGIGLGDAKFMAGAGVWVGWQGLAPLVLGASIGALLYVLIRRRVDGAFDLHQRVPFAPFLSAATFCVWFVQVIDAVPWL